VVFSCRSDSVAAIIDLCYSTPLLTDTIANKVYAGTENGVAVIDGNTDRLLKTIASWSPWNQRAYFAGGDSSSQISVIRDFNLTGKSTSLPVLPAVVKGSIFWHRDETGYLYDATGKRIRELLPGKNSLEQIAPGVYFVRQRSAGEPQAKVIVIK